MKKRLAAFGLMAVAALALAGCTDSAAGPTAESSGGVGAGLFSAVPRSPAADAAGLAGTGTSAAAAAAAVAVADVLPQLPISMADRAQAQDQF